MTRANSTKGYSNSIIHSSSGRHQSISGERDSRPDSLRLHQRKKEVSGICLRRAGWLDTERELDADINVTRHFDDLTELDRLFGGRLQIVNREDLQSRLVDLRGVLGFSGSS